MQGRKGGSSTSTAVWKPGRKRLTGWIKYTVSLLSLAFLFYSIYHLDLHLDRLLTMYGPLGKMFSQLLFPPEMEYVQRIGVLKALLETFQIATLASVIGTLLCIPLAWFAAYNMTPSRQILFPLGRFAIGLARSINILIWAILLTHILGFGPLPGTLALMFLTIGFAGKLFSEEIEAIQPGPVEAMRATGAGMIQVMYYGVLPQVRVAWVGITIYNWDSTFRAATIVGYVGAGGIGAYLRETIGFLEYSKTGAIIITIILLVIVSEAISAYVRDKVC